MDEKCKAALELLVQNGYLEAVKGKYRCTQKLNQEMSPLGIDVGKGPDLTAILCNDWEGLYVQFIRDAEVPKRGETSTGEVYDLNKYSEEAMKRFRQMIEKDRIDLSLLARVTKAYYKGPGRYKKTISNYILEGIWRMDYLTLKDKPVEQQQQQLKEQMHDPTNFTRDRIG